MSIGGARRNESQHRRRKTIYEARPRSTPGVLTTSRAPPVRGVMLPPGTEVALHNINQCATCWTFATQKMCSSPRKLFFSTHRRWWKSNLAWALGSSGLLSWWTLPIATQYWRGDRCWHRPPRWCRLTLPLGPTSCSRSRCIHHRDNHTAKDEISVKFPGVKFHATPSPPLLYCVGATFATPSVTGGSKILALRWNKIKSGDSGQAARWLP